VAFRSLSPARLADAVAALARGEVIGLPTETVYGLAGDAASPAAVLRIFQLKGRPAHHPLIVHLGSAGWLDRWALDLPWAALQLSEQFWPGPLTLILKRRPEVLDTVTGGQDTVGLRVPSHPVAQSVLHSFGRALAAPSANRFGHVSPTLAEHVREEFGQEVPIVLDGGPCDVGIESTIVDLSGRIPRILRPGHVTAEEIESVIGPVAVSPDAVSPRVPGALASHYAPRTKTEVLPKAALLARASELSSEGKRVLALAIETLPDGISGLALEEEASDYARHLYAALRKLDAGRADRLLIEAPPGLPEWDAVRDRLTRAAAPGEPDGS
jgi:L-threonylcarbamoyladenylate synthase